MAVRLHPHAEQRLAERGATRDEVTATVEQGARSPAKHGRTRFRRTFNYNAIWRGRHYAIKQIDAFAVSQGSDWFVITVIVKYF